MEPTSARPARIPLAGTVALQGDAAPSIFAAPVLQQHPGAQGHKEGSHRRTEADKQSWPPDSGKSDAGTGGVAQGPLSARTGATPDVAQPAAEKPGASGSRSSKTWDGAGRSSAAEEQATFGWAEQAAVVRAGQKDEMYAHEVLVYITGAEQKRCEFVLYCCLAAPRARIHTKWHRQRGKEPNSSYEHTQTHTRKRTHKRTHTHATHTNSGTGSNRGIGIH